MRRTTETKVPGSRASGNRAAQDKRISSTESTRPQSYPRLPFPRLPLRLFFGWPEGLASAVGMPWYGRREAA